jgi:hypothetical protein
MQNFSPQAYTQTIKFFPFFSRKFQNISRVFKRITASKKQNWHNNPE